MTRHPALVSASAVLLVLASVFAAGLTGTSRASAAARSLCGSQSAPVAGGAYVAQNDEWNSSAGECLTLRGGTAFVVSSSSIANATDGSPGAFPSQYTGCHWGQCSSGGLAARPLRVSALANGVVTTTWTTAQPYRTGEAYDAAYDIWVNRTPRTSGAPNGSEVMIWLNHRGPVQPAGHIVARNVKIGVRTYNIWYSPAASSSSQDIISYTLTTRHMSVTGLDIGKIIRNSVARGYTNPAWYLISVEAGFELWRGGAGLATKSLGVRVK